MKNNISGTKNDISGTNYLYIFTISYTFCTSIILGLLILFSIQVIFIICGAKNNISGIKNNIGPTNIIFSPIIFIFSCINVIDF